MRNLFYWYADSLTRERGDLPKNVSGQRILFAKTASFISASGRTVLFAGGLLGNLRRYLLSYPGIC
jgi:hypothetical protein